MSKKETSIVHTAIVGDQGTTFGKEGLEKEAHMEKEKRCGIMKNQKI